VVKVINPPVRWGRKLHLLMMDKPWFDQETGTLLLDEYVVEMDSYRRIVEDETISDAELVEQTQRVTSLLQQLEETLSPEAKALATEALGELAVLSALQVKRLQAASVIPQ
jgi:flagellin-specific chaperone FliS